VDSTFVEPPEKDNTSDLHKPNMVSTRRGELWRSGTAQ
jgi:hypothetical protein